MFCPISVCYIFCFFFNDTATTQIYTLSLHDALPIYVHPVNIQTACLIMEGAEFTENIINGVERPVKAINNVFRKFRDRKSGSAGMPRPISYAVFCLKKKKNIEQEDALQAVRRI